jgi:geranylgeranyl diphosphate synthase type II
MAYKKTCWYTVIAPLRIGVICGSAAGAAAPMDEELDKLIELGFLAGIAFQIHDDLLNLEADEELYGKEQGGDLWEGKRTIMLLHFLRTASARVRGQLIKILRAPRSRKKARDIRWLHRAMNEAGSLDYGRSLAIEYSERAIAVDSGGIPVLRANRDRRFLREMLRYVIDRAK